VNIYKSLDYRKSLELRLAEKRKWERGYTYSKMAEVIGVQQPYLSKVMDGHANFNSDQLFLACEFLQFNPSETEFLLLLLEHSKCIVKKRCKLLLEQIEAIRAKHLDTREFVQGSNIAVQAEGASIYYLDPMIQIVHVALTIEEYRKNLKILAD